MLNGCNVLVDLVKFHHQHDHVLLLFRSWFLYSSAVLDSYQFFALTQFGLLSDFLTPLNVFFQSLLHVFIFHTKASNIFYSSSISVRFLVIVIERHFWVHQIRVKLSSSLQKFLNWRVVDTSGYPRRFPWKSSSTTIPLWKYRNKFFTLQKHKHEGVNKIALKRLEPLKKIKYVVQRPSCFHIDFHFTVACTKKTFFTLPVFSIGCFTLRNFYYGWALLLTSDCASDQQLTSNIWNCPVLCRVIRFVSNTPIIFLR